tara:strand:- start:31 stop:849 length:819 start_codon:yes stop_codon:yes gene_type:complete
MKVKIFKHKKIICLCVLLVCLLLIPRPLNKETFNNKLKNERKTYTITGKKDGFGAQYQAIMSGIAYSNYMNYIYVHTPFYEVEHTQDIKSLNKFIGIPFNNNNKNIDIVQEYSASVHNSQHPSKYYTRQVLDKIRKLYHSNSKPNINNIDIAIHIRRGDVNKNSNSNRYTNNNKYKKYIDYFLKKYPKYNITIFSQGNETDFQNLKHSKVSFDLNSNVEKTFHSLVMAKVLLISKSSFSYSSALLNKNTIYYIDFWHKPLQHWLLIDNEINK